METWWSGLTYLFAKEAGLNGPRGFESLRFRNDSMMCRKAQNTGICEAGFEKLEYIARSVASTIRKLYRVRRTRIPPVPQHTLCLPNTIFAYIISV